MKTSMLIKQALFVIFGCCCIFSMNVHASDATLKYRGYYHGFNFGESGSAEAMTADVLIARPIGLVTTVISSTIYVISLPFSLLGGNETQAREKLVKEPMAFTFKRPLGEFPSLE